MTAREAHGSLALLVRVVFNNDVVVVFMSNYGPSAVARRKIEVQERWCWCAGSYAGERASDPHDCKVILTGDSARGMSLEGVKEAARKL